MSEYPKYLVFDGEDNWLETFEVEAMRIAKRAPDRAVYRIDAATKVWPVAVTYRCEWSYGHDWHGDEFGPIESADEAFTMRSECGAVKRGECAIRIIDSTGKVIREWKPEVVRFVVQGFPGDGPWRDADTDSGMSSPNPFTTLMAAAVQAEKGVGWNVGRVRVVKRENGTDTVVHGPYVAPKVTYNIEWLDSGSWSLISTWIRSDTARAAAKGSCVETGHSYRVVSSTGRTVATYRREVVEVEGE